MKRLIIATLLGLVFGFVCLSLAKSGGSEISTALALSIVLGRLLIGFTIGISKFSFKHWSIHGLLIGLIVSLPAGFGAMLGPENPNFTHQMMFFSTVITGMIYGLLIELVTSVIFKAKQ